MSVSSLYVSLPGESSTLTCMLPTFDKTPPEVFVRDLHSITSYSEQLFVIVSASIFELMYTSVYPISFYKAVSLLCE